MLIFSTSITGTISGTFFDPILRGGKLLLLSLLSADLAADEGGGFVLAASSVKQ